MADQRGISAQPSGIGATALGVALLRARESRRSDRLFHDPYAQVFVDRAGPGQRMEDGAGSGPDFFQLVAEQVAVRTRFFDEALLAAVCSVSCHVPRPGTRPEPPPSPRRDTPT